MKGRVPHRLHASYADGDLIRPTLQLGEVTGGGEGHMFCKGQWQLLLSAFRSMRIAFFRA